MNIVQKSVNSVPSASYMHGHRFANNPAHPHAIVAIIAGGNQNLAAARLACYRSKMRWRNAGMVRGTPPDAGRERVG